MVNITVYDFMRLNTEDQLEPFLLWDNEGKYIYEGDLYSLPSEYEDLIVQSWNIEYSNKFNSYVVCLNVSLED